MSITKKNIKMISDIKLFWNCQESNAVKKDARRWNKISTHFKQVSKLWSKSFRSRTSYIRIIKLCKICKRDGCIFDIDRSSWRHHFWHRLPKRPRFFAPFICNLSKMVSIFFNLVIYRLVLTHLVKGGTEVIGLSEIRFHERRHLI